jgi:hypothetical protein
MFTQILPVDIELGYGVQVPKRFGTPPLLIVPVNVCAMPRMFFEPVYPLAKVMLKGTFKVCGSPDPVRVAGVLPPNRVHWLFSRFLPGPLPAWKRWYHRR